MVDISGKAGKRVEGRLREEKIAWLTTVRADGQPQSVPVWFLWDGETLLVYSQPGRQKLRNIGRNQRVGFNLNSNEGGGDVVRAEGEAKIVQDAPPATDVPEYIRKYRDHIARIGYEEVGFAKAYSIAVRITPTRWQAW